MDKRKPELTNASGHQAEAQNVIDVLQSRLEKHGVDVDGDFQEGLRDDNWRDPVHRNYVQKLLDGFDPGMLPGMGPDGRASNARDYCGNPHPFMCDSCGDYITFGNTCAMSVCARCAPVWARDAAIQKAAKVRRLRKEKHYETPDDEHQKIHHLAISFPVGWYRELAKAGLSHEKIKEETQKATKDILVEMRAQGIVVRHPFRGVDDDGTLASEYDDRGEWKERLFSRRNWWGDVRDELGWMPHYHCMVVADWARADDEFQTPIEEATGVSIHRIEGRDGKKSIPTDGAMARALTYNISHAELQVNPDGNNSSAIWEVGSFHGEQIKSTPKFSPEDHDLSWATAAVNEELEDILGMQPTSTNCNAEIPGVDDPDELARRILEELYPGEQHDVPADVVLDHVERGNISVSVSTSSGGGGDVTVTDAFGEPVGEGGWGGDLPDAPSTATPRDVAELVDQEAGAIDAGVDDVGDHGADCSCGDEDDEDTCDGTYIPLEEGRHLLEDDDWVQDAPNVDQAREADEKWPEDLDHFKTEPPGDAAPPAPG